MEIETDVLDTVAPPQDVVSRVADVDGDGLPDLIADEGGDWQVFWGDGERFATSVTVPAPAASLSRRLTFDSYDLLRAADDAGTPDGPFFTGDLSWDLVDVDADGWLDVIKVDASGTEVAWRVRDRSAAWQAFTPVPGPAWDAIRIVEVTLQGIDIVDSQGVTDLADLNGDGLPDLVDTRGYAANGGHWEVWLGTGRGFEAPVLWRAPGPYTDVTQEGAPEGPRYFVADSELSCSH
jgi:hypothetical protein